MEKIRKLFFNINFTWIKVLIFAVLSAAVVAVLNLIPATEGTSFRDPATNVDVWILFALLIIMNSKGYKEAALKTFVFFLISQPLIYLIEVPFVADGWSIFRYYKYWGMITLLTVPGACIAYRVKKQDALSAAILSLAAGLLLIMAINYSQTLSKHLLSFIFCIGLAVILILALLEGRKERIIALVLAVLIAAAGAFYIFNTEPMASIYMLDGSHQWTITSEISDGYSAQVLDGCRLEITPALEGEYTLTVADEQGNEEVIAFRVTEDAQYIEFAEE